MKPKNWKDLVLIGAAALALAGGGYGISQYTQQHQDKGINYVGNDQADQTKHEKTPDEISAEEGIDAEQIVVKITDEGYVTSHGDHFHYFNGKVPFDAIFSEELVMKDANYQLNKKDIQYEVKDGYVIKVNGQYYLYLKDPKHATNVRTKEEIQEQRAKYTKDGKKADTNHSGSRVNGRYTTDDGYVFSPNDVLQDLGDGYIVPHGDHFHFIPKSDLTAAEIAAAEAHLRGHGGTSGAVANKFQQLIQKGGSDGQQTNGRYTTDDGYVFNASDIIKEVPGGYIVPHGTHYHFIPRAQLSASEKAAADAFLGKGGQTPQHRPTQPQRPNNGAHHQNQPKPSQPVKPSAKPDKKPETANYYAMSLNDLLKKIYSLPKSQRHVESDGLIFDPAKVTGKNEFGYIHPHGDHFHIIPTEQLSTIERVAADRVLAKDWGAHPDQKPNKPADSHNHNKPNKPSKPDNKPDNGNKPSESEKPGNSNKPNKPGDSHNHDKPNKPSKPDNANKPGDGTNPNHGQKLDLAKLKQFKKSPQGKDGKTYTTDDGYTFTVESVVDVTETGVVAKHDKHTHFIPFGDLEDRELEDLVAYINEGKKPNQADKPSQPDNSNKPSEPAKPDKEDKPGKDDNASKPEKPSHPDKPSEPAKPDKGEKPNYQTMPLADLLDLIHHLPMNERHVESDGLVFDPAKVTGKTKYGYIHPHGDHHHVIAIDELSEVEKIAAERVLKEGLPGKDDSAIKPDKEDKPGKDDTTEKPNKEDKPAEEQPNTGDQRLDLAKLKAVPKNKQGKDGKPYTTNDGYTFTVASVIEVTNDGVVAKHGEHTHYIPFGDLEDRELEALVKYVNDDNNHVEDGTQTTLSEADIQKRLLYVALESGMRIDQLKRDGNQVIIPHGNHFHTKDLRHVPSALRKADAKHLEEITGLDYEQLIISLKMNYLEAYQGAKHVIRDGNKVVFEKDGKTQELAFNAIKIEGLDYDEIDLTDLDKPSDQEQNNEPNQGKDHHGDSDSKPNDKDNHTQPDHSSDKDGNKTPNKQPEKDNNQKPDNAGTASDHKQPEKVEDKNEATTPTDQSATPNHGRLDLNKLKAIKKTAKGQDGKTYTTDDGYTFSVESIIEVTNDGVVAKHEQHTHYIPFGDFDDNELEMIVNYVNDHTHHVADGTTSTFSAEEIAKKMRFISYESGIHIDQLKRDGNQVVIPHGNHFHTKDLTSVPSVLRKADAKHLEEITGMDYTTMIAAMKMKYLRTYRGATQVVRDGAIVHAMLDGKKQDIPLKDIKLEGLDYEEPDFGPVTTTAKPQDKAKVEKAQKAKGNVKAKKKAEKKVTAKKAANKEMNAMKKATASEKSEANQPTESLTKPEVPAEKSFVKPANAAVSNSEEKQNDNMTPKTTKNE
ncbi:MAG: pneumococcal-type histidine triad protein [Aerococcus sp.]|nr:pneumococcal-type histidine triad protein [Aerococcus sp.]